MEPTPDTIRRYHVFLASPGDVREQRDFVRAHFADYNIQFASAKGVEFQVVDWESWSTLGVGEPQKLITRQLLDRHRNSLALVIGILGQRFGTPTSTHESGTEEEFEWALQCWKESGSPEIKWFFLDPEKLTVPKDRQERKKALEQWEKVEDFRERLREGDEGSGDPQLYFGTFRDLESFKEAFRRDLNLWLGASERPWNAQLVASARPTVAASGKSEEAAREGSKALLDYLDRLREENGKIRLIGLGQDIQVELDILEVYVPLKTVAARSFVADERERAHWSIEGGESVEAEEPIDINRIFVRAADFGHRAAVLLGDPGAGKTTAARQLVFSLASGRVAPETLGLPPGLVPVSLRFRALESGDEQNDFVAFLERELAPCYEDDPEKRRQARAAVFERPRLLWVLDGLDEVVDESLRRGARDWVLRLLRDRPKDYFLVTSRFQGYRGKAELGGAFVEFQVQPMRPEDTRCFVRQWYDEVFRRLQGRSEKTSREANELIESLIGILDGPTFTVGSMPDLPANPLLLTILCVVHHQDRSLPRRRADLYARCVRVLLEHWRMDVWQRQGARPFDAPSAERVLGEVAWRMHQTQGQTAMDVGAMAKVAEVTLDRISEAAGLGRDGAGFLRRMRDRCGVLAMVGDGKCAFLHLTFQEYLAALHAKSRTLAQELAGAFGETWWRECTLLAMAIGRPEFMEAFFDAVLAGKEWQEHLDLLGECLDEAQNLELAPFVRRLWDPRFSKDNRLRLLRLLAPRELPQLGEVAEQIATSETGEMASLALQIARKSGRLLGPASAEAGSIYLDERTGIEFVWIPLGSFTMGGDHVYDGKPAHRVALTEGFWLGRYAITNKDYRKFLESENHAKPRYWTEREYNADQQPVVGVSWDAAQAFCRWAGYRLPTEVEWEYACRAGSTGAYCFGDDECKLGEFAWYSENSDGKLRAVGQKKANKWGLYDMHGNVWEWCEDWYRDYLEVPVPEPTSPKSGSLRVVRGGCWFRPAGVCRSALRGRSAPWLQDDDLGFRVVLARSPVQEQRRAGRP